MGRKTYEDMLQMVLKRKKKKDPAKIKEILPGRQSFVITSNPNLEIYGATATTSMREAIQSLDEKDDREIFVIGGERLFKEALAWTDTIYMTIINGEPYGCDVFFPISELINKFNIVEGEQNDKIRFVTYKRIQR